MNIKIYLSILLCLASFLGISQKSYQAKYALILQGQITNHENQPIPNLTIKSFFKYSTQAFSPTVVVETKTDSLGKYELKLEKNGHYKIEFGNTDHIVYHVESNYSKIMAEQMRKREFPYTFNVQLYPVTKKVKTDIYNGGEIQFRGGEPLFVPYKKYLQSHDYKQRKGFKSPEKLAKYVAKRIKKQQLNKILGVVATRDEIDTIIKNDKYLPEIRERWQTFFGKTYPDMDKVRLEYIQDFYAKISARSSEDELIYNYFSNQIDMTKTVIADDTKEVFTLYRYNFMSADNKKISFDIMFINTLKGWKINYISENYE